MIAVSEYLPKRDWTVSKRVTSDYVKAVAFYSNIIRHDLFKRYRLELLQVKSIQAFFLFVLGESDLKFRIYVILCGSVGILG
jgi:hypothetical protein